MHMKSWLTLHLPQLIHYNVPQHLYQDIFDCLHRKNGNWSPLDAVAMTQRTPEPADDWISRRRQRVVATVPLLKASKVLHIHHKWTFRSVVDAQMQLRQNCDLRTTMQMLVRQVLEKKNETISSEHENQNEDEADFIVRNLHFLAFSVRFGATSDDMAYYVLNTLGSSLSENDRNSNIKVIPIYCMEQQTLFTIAWTTKDVGTGAELVRPCASKIALMGLCKKSYWEARFETEEDFDWYCEYSHIREIFVSYVAKTERVLVAGTGTSRLPTALALDGYSNVVAMDYAANVIKKMQLRSKHSQWGVQFVVADLTLMEGWQSNSVDCVIDKGCLDAMLIKAETDTKETHWKQVAPDSSDDLRDARNSMQQLARILKPDGLLFFLTFGNPRNRVNMFDWVAPDQTNVIEWDILQCLEMSPTNNQHTFATRFFLFVARKKLK